MKTTKIIYLFINFRYLADIARITSLASLALFFATHAPASTWSGTGNPAGNWSSNANPGWNGTGVPNAVGAVANWATAGTANVTLDESVTVGGLEVSGSGGSFGVINPGSNIITFNNGGASNALGGGFNGAVLVNSGTTTSAVVNLSNLTSSNLKLSDNLLIANTGSSTASTGAIRIGGLSGTGNVTFSNVSNSLTSAEITLGASTFTGSVTIAKGAVSATSMGASANTVTLGSSGGGSATWVFGTATGSISNQLIVAAGSGGTLEIGSVDTTHNTSDVTYNGSITLNDNLTLISDKLTTGTNAVIYSGVISGTGGLTITSGSAGASITRITGTNTFSGNTRVGSGLLQLDSSSGGTKSLALQDSTLDMNAADTGSISFGSGTSTTITSAVFGGLTGSRNLDLDNSNATPAAVALSIGNNNTNQSYSGQLTGAGSLTKIGSGTQTLSGNNTYTGSTTIANGNLSLTGSLAMGSAVTIGNNTATTAILSGTGTANGNVTTAVTSGSNVAYLAPGVNTTSTRGDFGSAGTLHVGGNLSLGTGTNLDFDLSSSYTSGNDQIAVGGTLTIGTALTFNYNELTANTLDTTGAYQLITFNGTAPNLGGVTFTSNGTGSYTAVYSIDGGGKALDVTFSLPSVTPTAAFFNGQGTDLGTFANYDTDVSSGTAVSAALGNTTNVSFNANRNATVSTATLNTALDINSVKFGTGSGIHSGMAINGTGTMTIEATTANGNTIGNGITVATAAGNNAINTAVTLGNDQTWTVTDATSTLTLGGNISGAHKLTTAGNGVVKLASLSGNNYSGGTEVNSPSKLLIANTSGSATGTNTLTVDRGATLAGSGIVNATGGSISLGASGSGTTQVYVGQTVGGDTNTSSNMTLKAASGLSIANTTLTFNLNTTSVGGSGTPSSIDGTGTVGSSNELVVGNTAVSFGSGVTLQLNLQGGTTIAPNTPYVLFAGTGSGSGLNGSIYSGLTSGGTDANGNIIIQGLTLNIPGYGPSYVFLNQSGGVDDIEVEVVPEPGTWALMAGGVVMLILWQRRKRAD